MKVIVTGSLGNISKPLTKELAQQDQVKVEDFAKEFAAAIAHKSSKTVP